MNLPTIATAQPAYPSSTHKLGASNMTRIVSFVALTLINILLLLYVYLRLTAPHPGIPVTIVAIVTATLILVLLMREMIRLSEGKKSGLLGMFMCGTGPLLALIVVFSIIQPPNVKDYAVSFLNGSTVSSTTFAWPFDSVRHLQRVYRITLPVIATTADKVIITATISAVVCIDEKQGVAPHTDRSQNDQYELTQSLAAIISDTAGDVLSSNTLAGVISGGVDKAIQAEIMLPLGFAWEDELRITEVRITPK